MDMSKRAFFIIGPEGCGTYMLAEAFVSAGCTYCDKDEIEEFLKEQQPNNLVVRRSIPHAGDWYAHHHDHIKLRNFFTRIHIIGIVREKEFAQKSVLRRKPETSSRDYDTARAMMEVTFAFHSGHQVQYEGFVTHPNVRENLFSNFNLPPPEMEFYDGNEKYFK